MLAGRCDASKAHIVCDDNLIMTEKSASSAFNR